MRFCAVLRGCLITHLVFSLQIILDRKMSWAWAWSVHTSEVGLEGWAQSFTLLSSSLAVTSWDHTMQFVLRGYQAGDLQILATRNLQFVIIEYFT